jgi:hypothetical protein
MTVLHTRRMLRPTRGVVRHQHRSPGLISGRRLPPTRGLFRAAPQPLERDDVGEYLDHAIWLFGLAVVMAVANVVAMGLLPALALPLYTLVVVSCAVAVFLATLAGGESRADSDEDGGAFGCPPDLEAEGP